MRSAALTSRLIYKAVHRHACAANCMHMLFHYVHMIKIVLIRIKRFLPVKHHLENYIIRSMRMQRVYAHAYAAHHRYVFTHGKQYFLCLPAKLFRRLGKLKTYNMFIHRFSPVLYCHAFPRSRPGARRFAKSIAASNMSFCPSSFGCMPSSQIYSL